MHTFTKTMQYISLVRQKINISNGTKFTPLPTDRNSWLAWILMFLSVEYGYYFFHRFSHELNLLWATHVVHHSSNFFNLTTALRYPSNLIFDLCRIFLFYTFSCNLDRARFKCGPSGFFTCQLHSSFPLNSMYCTNSLI